MKYSVDDVLFTRLYEKNQKGRKVLDIKQFGTGGWSYKFECKCGNCKSGFMWTPEWMLYTKDEFLVEVRSGTLLAMLCVSAEVA